VKRMFNGIGTVIGILMAAMGAIHSLLGWKQVQKLLEPVNVPADFISGLAVPWHYTGLGMIVFGSIVSGFFAQRLRGASPPAFPALVTGLFYVAFALLGAIFIKPDPTFAMFGIPGALILVSIFAGRTSAVRKAVV
jgi:hypothetical protein